MRTHLVRLLALALSLSAVACTDPEDPPEPVTRALVDAAQWERLVEDESDVFADQRPDDAECDESGYWIGPINQALEIFTDVCDYPTFAQPSLEAIAQGDSIRVRGYHGELTAEGPAQGYLGLALDGELVWEYEVDIPSDEVLIDEAFVMDRPLPAASDVQVHVHNHGANSWEVISIQVTHPGDPGVE